MKNTLSAALAVFLLSSAFASTGYAKIGKAQRAEFSGNVEKFATVTDTEGRQAWLLTTVLALPKKEALIQLKPLMETEDQDERFALGLALDLIGDKKGKGIATKAFGKIKKPYASLRGIFATLPIKKQSGLLAAFLADKKLDERADLYRYILTRPKLHSIMTKLLTSKKQPERESAKNALVQFPTVGFEKTISKMASNKKDGARRAIALHVYKGFLAHPQTRKVAEAGLTKLAGGNFVPQNAQAMDILLAEKIDAKRWLNIKLNGAKEKDVAGLLRTALTQNIKVADAQLAPLRTSKDVQIKTLSHALSVRNGDKKLVKDLQKKYGSVEFDDRLLAIKSLPYGGSGAASKALKNSIFEGREDIRKAAAVGFTKLDDPANLPVLKQALDGERNPAIKLLLIEAIGNIQTPQAAQILRFLVTNSDLAIKKATISALNSTRQPAAAKALEVLIRDRNTDIQWQAFLVVASRDIKRAKSYYKTVFRNPPANWMSDIESLDPKISAAIFDYIRESGGPSMKQKLIVRAWQNGELKRVRTGIFNGAITNELRQDLAEWLAMRGDAKATSTLEALVRKSTSPSTSRLAIWLLARQPKKALEPSFRGYLGLKDPVRASIASYGLTAIYAY